MQSPRSKRQRGLFKTVRGWVQLESCRGWKDTRALPFLSAVVGRHGGTRIDESRDTARWAAGNGDPGYPGFRWVEKECGVRRPHEEAGAGVL